jgi:hypothetical protein
MTVTKLTWSGGENSRAEFTRKLFCLHLKKMRGLPPHKLAAFHHFKDSIADAMTELYATIPVDEADDILERYFRTPPPPTEKQLAAVQRLQAKGVLPKR